jgi:uncharacterized protein
VLSLDGGGIKGTFSASVVADFEETLGEPLVDYFDRRHHRPGSGTWAHRERHPQLLRVSRPGHLCPGEGNRRWDTGREVRRGTTSRSAARCVGDRLLGEAKTRLVRPATNLDTGDVRVFKTAHHARFERDYKARVVDVAMATAAAPTYFRTHRLPAGTPLIDGGLWANNPMGAAAVEALGVLDWPKGSVRLLGISCTESAPTVRDRSRTGLGIGRWLPNMVGTFMNAQSSASIGMAVAPRASIERGMSQGSTRLCFGDLLGHRPRKWTQLTRHSRRPRLEPRRSPAS